MAPVCIVVLKRETPSLNDTITYVSPKHLRPLVDEFTIVIEPQDRRSLTVQDAIADPLIWSKLMWGSTRDLQFLRKLQGFTSLKQLEREYVVKSQRGFVLGDRKKSAPYFEGKRLFNKKFFPPESIFSIETDDLPVVDNILVHSRDSTSLEAFSYPQLVVKLSWNKPTGRFHARLNLKDQTGILCNQSYLSVHAEMSVLEAACFSHNSKVAVYFHFLTSGRFAVYRPKLSKGEILGLPIPFPSLGLLDGVKSYSELDARAFELFGLKDAERVLIEDAIEYTLNDFLRGKNSKGKQSTSSGDVNGSDAHLCSYCTYFLRVLKAGFGNENSASATVFRCPSESMPYRLVAFTLGGETENDVEVKNIESRDLLEELERMNKKVGSGGGIYNQRVARIYEASNGVPTVFVIKPDQKRFWTRSMGLQDGDEVALDLFRWREQVVTDDQEALH